MRACAALEQDQGCLPHLGCKKLAACLPYLERSFLEKTKQVLSAPCGAAAGLVMPAGSGGAGDLHIPAPRNQKSAHFRAGRELLHDAVKQLERHSSRLDLLVPAAIEG